MERERRRLERETSGMDVDGEVDDEMPTCAFSFSFSFSCISREER